MKEKEQVQLARDCDAIIIPDGNRMRLTKGTQVMIQQSLGGSYTVVTDLGYMVRINGIDADAIGKEVVKPPDVAVPSSVE